MSSQSWSLHPPNISFVGLDLDLVSSMIYYVSLGRLMFQVLVMRFQLELGEYEEGGLILWSVVGAQITVLSLLLSGV